MKWKTWIKEHEKICIFATIVVVVVVVIIIAHIAGGSDTEENVAETATVERRTLTESVSATGTFVAADEERLTSDTTGVEVLAVNVEVGDTVAAGDTICVLDTKELEEDLADARENLSDTNESTRRTRDNAKRNLDSAATTRDEDLVDVDTNIQDAYDDWQNAETTYNESVASYNEAVALADSIEDKTSTAYTNASSQVATLKRQVDSDRRTADSYKSTYDRLVANREDNIKQINDTYQNQVDSYNDTMDNTKDSGETQQERIEEIEEQIAGATVKATVSGLVTAVNVEVGDDYNGSVIAVIDNVDSFDITTEIDEYDINSIEVGQSVVIKTNATGDEELTGTVKKISPIATGSSSSDASSIGGLDLGSLMGGSSSSSSLLGGSSSSDDVTFTVTIALGDNDSRLRIGMTAKLNIILKENADVLSVPYNAVQTDDDGASYYVEVITGTNEDGSTATKRVTVDKGVESDYYIEILNSGLEEGTEVLVPAAEAGSSLEDLINSSSSMGGI